MAKRRSVPPAPLSGRERILARFAELVAERGYGQTSIGDVAALAGVSKGTVVHHFGTKEQLLVEVQLDFMIRRVTEANRILAAFSTPTEQLIAMVYALLRLHRDDRIPARTFMREITLVTHTPAMEPVRRLRDEYTALIAGIVERGMDEGVFRRADVALTTLQIFGMCNHAWTWYRPEGPHQPIQISRAFLLTFLNGLVHGAGQAVSGPALDGTLAAAETLLDQATDAETAAVA